MREKLEKHRINLVDIDLRWGVTKEQAHNDEALDVSLEQIDECRPYFMPGRNRINLPTLSVVTYLHEFAHSRGADERQACGWSINLFRRIFPRSYARCRHQGHMLIAGR